MPSGAFGAGGAGQGTPARDPADLAREREDLRLLRIHAASRDEGERVSRKRLARPMREMGIEGVTRRRFRGSTTKRAAGSTATPDLVARDFSADGRDRLWVADITYVPTSAGWFYLAVVVDVWSRRVVGWAMARQLSTHLARDALTMAVTRRQPQHGLVHHSDQGSQYTSTTFGELCGNAGIRQSMGSVGDALDNALCESFFATLETELIGRRRFPTRAEARPEVFGFIDGVLQSSPPDCKRLHCAA